jgi:hypothetical protein
MTDELVVQEPETKAAVEIIPQFHAIAVNAQEMASATAGIKEWLVTKLTSIDHETADLQEVLDAAIKHKWKSSTFKGQIAREKQKRMYYQKLLDAVNAGFTIVPNMDCNTFAIRTRRTWPKWNGNEGTSTSGYHVASPGIPDEEEERLPSGQGHYESVDQKYDERKWKTSEGGKEIYHVRQNCHGFDQIEFPLAIAHPVVMNTVARAMAMKIFDKIGIVPTSHRRLKGDPIVLGQITRKEGYSAKTASFLIAWYLDPRTL